MKYTTKSNRTWDTTKGWSGQLNNNVSTKKGKGKYDMLFSTDNKYYDWAIPTNDFANVGADQVTEALNFAVDYLNKDGHSTKDTEYTNKIKEIMRTGNSDAKLAYIDYILDQNIDKTGFDSGGAKYEPIKDKDGKITGYKKVSSPQSNLSGDSNEASGLAKYRDLVTQSLMTNPNGEMAQQYRDSMYGSIAGYENSAKATLASAEMDAYRALGQSQLQLENQIASERMNAIKSGVTSSQLASREIANMFAAQSGAAQVASTMAQNRAQMYNQFGQQRASVEGDLWNIINSNQQTSANAYAQLGAAQSNYASYMNSYEAQLRAMANLYHSDPDAFNNIMTNKSQVVEAKQ